MRAIFLLSLSIILSISVFAQPGNNRPNRFIKFLNQPNGSMIEVDADTIYYAFYAKALLEGRDTLSCDTMIMRKNLTEFRHNVKLTSPDGMILHSEHMILNNRDEKK